MDMGMIDIHTDQAVAHQADLLLVAAVALYTHKHTELAPILLDAYSSG